MKIINLTPHPLVIYDDSGITDAAHILGQWPPTGTMARLPERIVPIPPITTDQGVMPTMGVSYDEGIEGLPEPQEGTVFVVSRVLAAEVPRPDVYFPFGEVRDADGRIIGCRALGQFSHSQRG